MADAMPIQRVVAGIRASARATPTAPELPSSKVWKSPARFFQRKFAVHRRGGFCYPARAGGPAKPWESDA